MAHAPRYLARAREYFRHMPEIRDLAEWRDRVRGGERDLALPAARREWSERFLFLEILRRFGVLPITTDSHFGEYVSWAHEVVDHQGILDFYTWYKGYCLARREPEIRMEGYEERVVPIMEGILGNAGFGDARASSTGTGSEA